MIRRATDHDFVGFGIPDPRKPKIERSVGFVVSDDDLDVGHIFAALSEGKWFVYGLEYWGDDKHGAAKLVQAVIKEIRRSSTRRVRVHCTPDAGIQHDFYRKRGFVPTVVFYEGEV